MLKRKQLKLIESIFFTLFFLIAHSSFAYDSLNTKFLRDIPVDFKVLVAEDESVLIKDILSHKWQAKFQSSSSFEKTSPDKFYWIRVDFKGHDLSQVKVWTLFAGTYSEIILYLKEGDSVGTRKSGILIPDKGNSVGIMEELPFLSDELINGRYLYLRIRHVQQFWPLPHSIFYSSLNASEHYSNLFSMEEISHAVPTFLFIGGVVVMMFYSFGIFFLYRDKSFLHYFFYLLALVLYLGRKTIFFSYFSNYPQLDYVFNEVIQVIVNIAYLSFVLNFINARKDYPLLDRVSRYVIVFLLFFIIVELGILTNDIFSAWQVYLINFERFFMAFFAFIGVLYILFTLKNKASLFIVIGSVCFTGGAVLSLLIADVRWMMAGAIAEIFIFALGLGYRFQKIQKEKRRIEREMDKVKLTALKAQMNPHFIFNSLNSIRSYIIVSETRKASDYLIKFSRLIRLILEYASSDYISLKEEVYALKLYVELEQMRFREEFNFTIAVDPNLDLDKVQIPPLIFQPYIENAIWHGLTPKSGEKSLSLIIEVGPKGMVCMIRDSGVGRTHAKKLRSQDTNKKSMALSLTKDRINLISQDSTEDNVSIIDLMKDGKVAGTEVKIILPLRVIAA